MWMKGATCRVEVASSGHALMQPTSRRGISGPILQMPAPAVSSSQSLLQPLPLPAQMSLLLLFHSFVQSVTKYPGCSCSQTIIGVRGTAMNEGMDT